MLVSVVVPVYKVEKYINRCIKSLLSQTLQNIEIILVDDGSPDNCPQICDEWKKRDNRIKVIHKENGGLSSARNAGIKVATGEYIGFVDSDDDVDPDMYEKMLRVAEKYQVDFVMADYQRIESDANRFLKTLDIDGGYYDRSKIERDIFPKLIMQSDLEYGPLLSVWHCLYRTDFLSKYQLRFDEEVRWSEDNIFSAIMGFCAQSFYYLKGEGLYHYYNNPGTITTSYRKGAWQVYSKMNDHLHDFFDGVDDYDFSQQLKLHMIYYSCNCIGMELSDNKENAKLEISAILNDPKTKDAFKNLDMSAMPRKLKIQLLLMKYQMTNLIFLLKG